VSKSKFLSAIAINPFYRHAAFAGNLFITKLHLLAIYSMIILHVQPNIPLVNKPTIL